jgi:hypothetical protein
VAVEFDCGRLGSVNRPVSPTDAACAAHDECYGNVKASWVDNLTGKTPPRKVSKMSCCDNKLCDDLRNAPPARGYERVSRKVVMWFFECR